MVRTAFSYIAYMMSFAIGVYLFGISAMKEIRDMIQSFNDNLKTETTQADMMKKIIDAIRFSYLKQLVEKWIVILFEISLNNFNYSHFNLVFSTFYAFVDLYQITFVSLFLGCTAMGMIQQQLDQVFLQFNSIFL